MLAMIYPEHEYIARPNTGMPPTSAEQTAAPVTTAPRQQDGNTAIKLGLEKIAAAETSAKDEVSNSMDRIRKAYKQYKATEQTCARIHQLVETGGILKSAMPNIPIITTADESVNAEAQLKLRNMCEEFGRQVTVHIRDSQAKCKQVMYARYQAEAAAALSSATTHVTDLGNTAPYSTLPDLQQHIQRSIANIKLFAEMHVAADVTVPIDREFTADGRKPLVTAWKQSSGEESPDTHMPDRDAADGNSDNTLNDLRSILMKDLGTTIKAEVSKAFQQERDKQHRKPTAKSAPASPATRSKGGAWRTDHPPNANVHHPARQHPPRQGQQQAGDRTPTAQPPPRVSKNDQGGGSVGGKTGRYKQGKKN
jgi:hypothetical protein